MYSEQLESLIKSIIADGEITEKERAVLHKHAEAENIDTDEIDVYVDGLICKATGKVRPKREHPSELFSKEVYRDTECFKLKKKFQFNCQVGKEKHNSTAYIQIVDIIKWDDIINKTKKVHEGLALFISTKRELNYDSNPYVVFKANDQEISNFKSYYLSNSDIPTEQIIDGGKYYNWGVGIDGELLKALCDAKDISISVCSDDIDSDDIDSDEGLLIDDERLYLFEYYAQYCYRNLVDNTAYPNYEKEEQEIKKADAKEDRKSNIKTFLLLLILFIICYLFCVFQDSDLKYKILSFIFES